MITHWPEVDDRLAAHAVALGREAVGYRHHVYRVANFCIALSSDDAATRHIVALAAVHHDLGIWTAGTFDYLAPSRMLAADHLAATGRHDLIPEISAMIDAHHKVTRCDPAQGPLVEAFRRADWIDVTLGARRFGLSPAFVREAFAMWPSAGFHSRLVWRFLQRLASHPRDPLPMLRR